MRHEHNLRAHQCRDPHVFDKVVVVTNENPATAAEQIEHGEFFAGRQVRIDERVQLSMSRDESVAGDADVCVEEIVAVSFKQPGKNRHAEFARDVNECPNARAVRDRFGQRSELGFRE